MNADRLARLSKATVRHLDTNNPRSPVSVARGSRNHDRRTMNINDSRIQGARTYALGTRKVSENRPTDEKLLGMAEAAEAVLTALGIPLDGDHWLDKTPIGDL